MRLLLVLLAFALAAPAEAQELFFQSCMTSAGADLPPGVSADALCGCATQRSLQAGTAPRDLDALVDYVVDDRSMDAESVPERLQPTLEVASQALVGCVMQVGLAGMMEAAMTEAFAGAVAPKAGVDASPEAPAPAALGGVPVELMAEVGAPWAPSGAISGSGTPAASAPTVSPDGTVASAPSTRAERAAPSGFRTGAGEPPRRATQSSKGAAIRILE